MESKKIITYPRSIETRHEHSMMMCLILRPKSLTLVFTTYIFVLLSMMRESPILFCFHIIYVSFQGRGWGRGFFAILQKKIFLSSSTHDNSFFFLSLDEIEFGGSDLGM